MPSPFPGMDPYLEQHWGDVHSRLIIYASDQLQGELPRDLRARVEERVFVESPSAPRRPIIPDIRVVERLGRKAKQPAQLAGIAPASAEPLILDIDEEVTEGFIEIRDASSGHKLVTVIEALSPSNKWPGPGQEKYLQKREELRKSQVSLVEIDLLRAGPRPFPFHAEMLPPAYCTPYHIWVRRGWQSTKVEIYRVSLRERLPIIRIPLRRTDKDVPLDLQALVDECYRKGGYDNDLDYQNDPEPPLEPADARWTAALLRKAGWRAHRVRRRPS